MKEEQTPVEKILGRKLRKKLQEAKDRASEDGKKQTLTFTAKDMRKASQKARSNHKANNRHLYARRSNYVKRIGKMSNAALQREVLAQLRNKEAVAKELEEQKSKFMEMSVTLGLLIHPQINYNLTDLLLDGVRTSETTTHKVALQCKEDSSVIFIRAGDGVYWSDLGLKCPEGCVLVGGEAANAVVLSMAQYKESLEDPPLIEDIDEFPIPEDTDMYKRS